jgi:Bacterial Ig domain
MIKLHRIRIAAFIAAVVSLSVAMLTSASADAQTFANNSFESPVVSANTDSLRPAAASWTFLGQSGIRNNNAPNGSEGKQAAFVSAAPVSGNNNFGSVRQTVTLKPGTYYVRYLAAVKTPTGRPQPVQFYVNGVAQGGVLNPRYLTDTTTGGFESGWTQPFVVSSASAYELRFDATNATNYGTVASPLYAVAYLDAVTVVSVPTGFANAGFEATGTWTLSSGATAAAATDAPEGGKVLTMAPAATGSQSLALPAGRYSLSLKLGQASAASGTLNVEVASNGAAAATVAMISATTAAEYRAYSTVGFAVPSGSHVFTLRASGSSFSVDAISLNDAGPDAGNAGFETPVLAAPSSATAAGPTVANPTTATWIFSGSGGLVQANAGSSNTGAPRTISGKQHLALSGTGTVAQSLTLAGGTYVAVGQVAQGGVKVLVDGTQVGRLSASTLDFREVMSVPFVVAAGTRALSLAVDTTYSPATPKLDEFRLLRVDVPPAVSITAPANGAVFQTGATVDITASASDPDGISNLAISRTATGGSATQLASSASSPLSTSWSNSSANGYTITASATDSTGATSSTAINIRVNANPSSIVSISPTGPVVTSATAVTATVTVSAASDSDGTVTKIEFLQDAVVATTCTKTIPPAVAPFTCALSLAPRATAYSLTVRVTDNDGGTTTTAPLTLRINTAPTVTLTAACVAPCGAPGTVNLTTVPSDTDGTIAKVEFYDGTTLLATKTASPWTYSHTTAIAATHSYTAKAFDNDNASKTSVVQSVTVTAPVSAVALTASCTAPCNAPASVTVTAVLSNITASVSKVEFYDGATLLSSDTASPYSFAANSVAAATHSYTAKVFVSNNATAVATSLAQVVAVNALPTVNWTAPANNSAFNAGQTVALQASAADSDGSISKVEFFSGGTALIGVGIFDNGAYNFNWTTAPVGTSSLTAKATDNSGAVKTSTAISITVNPITGLSAAMLLPSSGFVSARGATVRLDASGTSTQNAIASVDFYANGAVLAAGTKMFGDTNSGRYTYQWPATVAGSYSITARVTDAVGNVAFSSARTVVVSPIAVQIISPAYGFDTERPSSISLTAAASTSVGSLTKVEFFHDGTNLIGASTLVNGNYSFNWVSPPVGFYIITAKATNSLGNVMASDVSTLTIREPSLERAVNGIARQSSTLSANEAKLAIAAVAGGLSSKTLAELSPWWEIDLGAVYPINSIILTPDSSCGAGQLRDALLYMTESHIPLESGADLSVHTDNQVYDTSVPIHWSGTGDFIWNATPGRKARFIRIWDKATTSLCLQRVRVMAASAVLPGVSIAAPREGLQIAVGSATEITLSISATTNGAEGALQKVEFFANQVKLGEKTAAPFVQSLSALPAGGYELRIKSSFSSGYVTWSPSTVITIQNATPTALSIASPTASGTVFTHDGTIPYYFVFNGTTRGTSGDTISYRIDQLPCCDGAGWTTVPAINEGAFRAFVAIPDGASTADVPRSYRLNIRLSNAGTVIEEIARNFFVERPTARVADRVKYEETGSTISFSGLVRVPLASTPTADVWFLAAVVDEDVNGVWTVTDSSSRRGSTMLGGPLPSRGLSALINADGTFSVSTQNDSTVLNYGYSIPRGWLGFTSGLYKAQPNVSVTQASAFRWGNVAPSVAAIVPTSTPMYAGSPIRVTARVTDFDDTRAPKPSDVVFSMAGAADIAAESCTYVPVTGFVVPGDLNYSYTFNCTRRSWPVAMGANQNLQIRYTDRTGNVATTTASISVTALSAAVVQPLSNATVPVVAGRLIVEALITPMPSGSIWNSTTGSWNTGWYEYWYLDGQYKTLRARAEGDTNAYELAGVAPGAHTAYVEVFSANGGYVKSATVSFVAVNNQPPRISIASPISPAIVQTAQPLTVRVVTSDPDGSVARVTLLVDGVPVTTSTTAPFDLVWTVPDADVTHTLKAVAYDNRGSATESAIVLVTGTLNPTAAPVITIETNGGAGGFTLANVRSLLPFETEGNACFVVWANGTPTDRVASLSAQLNGVAFSPVSFAPTLQAGIRRCLQTSTTVGQYRLDVQSTSERGAIANYVWNFKVEDFDVQLAASPRKAYFSDYRTEIEGDTIPFEITVQAGTNQIVNAFYAEDDTSGVQTYIPHSPRINVTTVTTPPHLGSFVIPQQFVVRRVPLGCATSVSGVVGCSRGVLVESSVGEAWPEYWVDTPGNAATVALTGATTVAPSALTRYTVTTTPSGGTTIVKVGLFDALTRQKLAEADGVGPHGFDIALTAARSIVAVALSAPRRSQLSIREVNGSEFVSPALAVSTGNIAPVVQVLSPVANATYAVNSPVPLTLQVADPDGSIALVTARLDGAATATPLTPPYATTLVTLAQLGLAQTAGPHSLSIEATDNQGTKTTVTVPFTLAPSFNGGLDGLTNYQNALINTPIPLRTSGLISGVIPTRVDYFINGQVLASASPTTAQSPFVVLWKPAIAGVYRVSLRAYDATGVAYVSNEVSLTVVDAPQITQTTAISPLGWSSFAGTVSAPVGSVVTVNGTVAQFDATTGRFFVNDAYFGAGSNPVAIIITLANGQVFNRTVTVSGTTTANYQVEVSPQRGLIPLSTDLYLKRLTSTTFTSVRITCDWQATSTQPSTIYVSSSITDGGSFGKCIYPNAGSYTVLYEFLDAANQVTETHVRRVLARSPVSDATAALTTYYSFLSYLLDNNVQAAVNVGFIDSARAQWQVMLAGLAAADRVAYATLMFKVRTVRVYRDVAELVVALPTASGNATEPYAVRLTVDANGFWRIEEM